MEEEHVKVKDMVEHYLLAYNVDGLITFIEHQVPAERIAVLQYISKSGSESVVEPVIKWFAANEKDAKIKKFAKQIAKDKKFQLDERDVLIEAHLKKHEDPEDKKSQPDELNVWIEELLEKRAERGFHSELPAEPGAEVPVHDLHEQILQAAVEGVKEHEQSAKQAFVIAKKVSEGKTGLTEAGITKLLRELESSDVEFSGTRLQVLEALPYLARMSGGSEKCGLLEKAINAFIHRGDSEEIMEKAIEALMEIKKIKREINGIPEDKKAFPQHKNTVAETPAKKERAHLAKP